MKPKEVFDVSARYILVLLSSVNNLSIFYLVFTPLTLYPVFWLLSMFYNASLSGNIITLYSEGSAFGIEFVDACIAGFAYFLLLALNLTTHGIKLKARIMSILLSFAAFLLLNIMRIVLLSALYVSGSAYFGAVHSAFWNVLSTLFVAGIWFLSAWLFRIKEIPAYSDIRFLYRNAKKRNDKINKIRKIKDKRKN